MHLQSPPAVSNRLLKKNCLISTTDRIAWEGEQQMEGIFSQFKKKSELIRIGTLSHRNGTQPIRSYLCLHACFANERNHRKLCPCGGYVDKTLTHRLQILFSLTFAQTQNLFRSLLLRTIKVAECIRELTTTGYQWFPLAGIAREASLGGSVPSMLNIQVPIYNRNGLNGDWHSQRWIPR